MLMHYIDPRWATPIKNFVRDNAQARAVNQVVAALNTGYSVKPPLRVVNGVSTPTASVVTTATATATLSRGGFAASPIDGLPTPVPLNVNKTAPTKVTLQTHHENDVPNISTQQRPAIKPLPEIPVPSPAPLKVYAPSLPTLEKAVAARIFFENIYFAILRKPPSREQRRRALENDLAVMRLSPEAKQEIRDRWQQNETDYLREKRAKVDPSAFVKLKTIGHGDYSFSSRCLWVKTRFLRCFRGGFIGERAQDRPAVRNETGTL